MIIHIPTEYDYHYVISENLDKLIYYLFLSKQLNSRQPVDLVVVTVVILPLIKDIEFLSNYAVKEKQKIEDQFKKLDGVIHIKESYKSKIRFEIFTDGFLKYFK